MNSTSYAEQLTELQKFLSSNGWEASVEEPQPAVNYYRIIVKLYTTIDEQAMYWPVELAYLPELEHDLKGFSLLQCFTPFIAEVKPANDQELYRLLLKVNPKLAIGSFGILPEHQLLFFKHNTIVDNKLSEAIHATVMETLVMMHYLLVNFHEVFRQVISGKTTAAEALNNSAFKNVYQ